MIFSYLESLKRVKRELHEVSLHNVIFVMSLEIIGNRLDDLFVFKEPEKEVKRGLHDVSLHNVDFL